MHEGNAPTLLPLRDDRHRQRDAVGRRLPRRARTTSARTGEGQELWTSLLDGGVDVRVRRAARRRRGRCRGPGSTRARPASTRCYRLYETQRRLDPDRGGRSPSTGSGSARVARRARARRRPALRDRDARGASTGQQLEALLEPRFRTTHRDRVDAPLDDAGVPNEIAVDTQGGRARALRRRQRAPRTRRGVRPPDHGAHAPVRQRSSTSRRRPATSAGPPPLRRRAHPGDPRVARLRRGPAWPSCATEGVVYWPDDDYSWTL